MPALVFPFHDPKNIEFKFLQKVTPLLKKEFNNAFVSITPKTKLLNPESVRWLQSEPFFRINFNQPDSLIGDHFIAGWKNVVDSCQPEQILHLCNSDRLSFELLNYRKEFLQDIKRAERAKKPTLFLRSAKAWSTHPQNYYASESLLTKAGEILFDKKLDFVWCHLTLRAELLKQALKEVGAHDLTVSAELAYFLKDAVDIKEVDWLAWEDPFIFGKNRLAYKKEREQSKEETQKRLTYVIPVLEFLINRAFTSSKRF